jgi:hypothetical protein
MSGRPSHSFMSRALSCPYIYRSFLICTSVVVLSLTLRQYVVSLFLFFIIVLNSFTSTRCPVF